MGEDSGMERSRSSLRRSFPARSLPRVEDERPRVALVDDHEMSRGSMRRAIESDERLRFAGEAPGGKEGLDLIRSTLPSVALVDIRMTPVDGWDVLEAVISEQLGTYVVFISVFDDPAVVQRALSSGAAGFISKGTGPDDLCELLLRAARGGRAVSAVLQEQLVASLGLGSAAKLSERELEVLRCISSGRTAKETANELGVGEATIASHTRAIIAKLGAQNSAAAVAEGFRRGLLS